MCYLDMALGKRQEKSVNLLPTFKLSVYKLLPVNFLIRRPFYMAFSHFKFGLMLVRVSVFWDTINLL